MKKEKKTTKLRQKDIWEKKKLKDILEEKKERREENCIKNGRKNEK